MAAMATSVPTHIGPEYAEQLRQALIKDLFDGQELATDSDEEGFDISSMAAEQLKDLDKDIEQ